MPHVPPETSVQEAGSWRRDGVDGLALSWSTGFGSATEGWLLRPAGEAGALPGIVVLHCHGGMKRYGKEKIANGPDAVARSDPGLPRGVLFGAGGSERVRASRQRGAGA